MTKRFAKGALTPAGLLLMTGLAVAPPVQADDCFPGDIDPSCSFGQPASDPTAGWTMPGDLVIPASGGPPEVAAAPAPPGAPVVTADGGMPVVPAGPPIG